jgi:hypothetical protein
MPENCHQLWWQPFLESYLCEPFKRHGWVTAFISVASMVTNVTMATHVAIPSMMSRIVMAGL